MKHVSLGWALLLGGLGMAGGAAAQAQTDWQLTGQVSHGNIGYTLFDLDPNDGIAPSLTFLPTPAAAEDRTGNLSAQIAVQTPVAGIGETRYGGDLAPFSFALGVPGQAGFELSASGRGNAGAAQVGLAARARPPSEGATTFGHGWIQNDPIGFVLSPGTRVSFSSAGSYAAEIAGGDFDGQFLSESRLLLFTSGADGHLALAEHDITGVDIRSRAGQGGAAQAGDFALGVDWYNWSAGQAEAYVGLNSYASIHLQNANPVPPVPEPGVLPMLAAGLAGLVLRSKRRCAGA